MSGIILSDNTETFFAIYNKVTGKYLGNSLLYWHVKSNWVDDIRDAKLFKKDHIEGLYERRVEYEKWAGQLKVVHPEYDPATFECPELDLENHTVTIQTTLRRV